MNDAALTPEQEELAAGIEDAMRAGAEVEIQRISRTLASKSDGELFGETEFQVRDLLAKLGGRAFDAALEERKKGGQGSSIACPECGEPTRLMDDRPAKLTSLFGTIHYERAYYHCRSGHFPSDRPLRLENKWHIRRGGRWRPRETTAMCQLRALCKSQRHLWDDFWRCDQAA